MKTAKNFPVRSSPDQPIFKKYAIRSSPARAKNGFSPDPVRSSPDPCSSLIRSRRFLGGVGFLTTLGAGVGFFCPTPDVQLDHFLNHTLKLGIPVEIVQFLSKLLLKQRFLPVHHDFHRF